jgi:hypothetical protein
MLPQENLNKKAGFLLPQLRLPSSAHFHSASPRAGTWAHGTAPSAQSVPATHRPQTHFLEHARMLQANDLSN